MKMKLREVSLPAKLVLIDHQGFLSLAKEQGEDNYAMAKKIADIGFVRVYGIAYAGHIPLLVTDVMYNGQEVGLSQPELDFFTVQKGI